MYNHANKPTFVTCNTDPVLEITFFQSLEGDYRYELNCTCLDLLRPFYEYYGGSCVPIQFTASLAKFCLLIIQTFTLGQQTSPQLFEHYSIPRLLAGLIAISSLLG